MHFLLARLSQLFLLFDVFEVKLRRKKTGFYANEMMS